MINLERLFSGQVVLFINQRKISERLVNESYLVTFLDLYGLLTSLSPVLLQYWSCFKERKADLF